MYCIAFTFITGILALHVYMALLFKGKSHMHYPSPARRGMKNFSTLTQPIYVCRPQESEI